MSGNNESQNTNERPKRDPIQNKVTARQMLAQKYKEGYINQVKDPLHKFGIEKL